MTSPATGTGTGTGTADPDPVASARAWPSAEYLVLGRQPAQVDGQSAAVLAVGPDGTYVTSVTGPSAGEGASRVVLVDPVRGTQKTLAATGAAGTGAYAAAIDGRFVVWMSSNETELNVQAWTLFAYDRRGGTTTELATAPRMDGGGPPPPPPGYTGPVLADGRVYWAQVSGTHGHERVDVVGCTVNDCRPRRFAAAAAFPQTAGGALITLSTPRFTGAKPGDWFRIQSTDPDTGRVTPLVRHDLAPRETPTGMAADSDHVAWTVSDGGADSAVVLDRRTDALQRFQSRARGSFGYPVMTSKVAAWAESSGSSPQGIAGYAWSFEDERLYTLGNTSGLYNLLGNGAILAWQVRAGHGGRSTILTYVTKER